MIKKVWLLKAFKINLFIFFLLFLTCTPTQAYYGLPYSPYRVNGDWIPNLFYNPPVYNPPVYNPPVPLFNPIWINGLYNLPYYGAGFQSLTRVSDVLLPSGTAVAGTSILPVIPSITSILSLTGIIPPVILPSGVILTVYQTPILQDPTGAYTGTWTSLLGVGTNAMTLNIGNVDPFTYSIFTSTAGLLQNGLIPISIEVSGIYSFPNFVLTGIYIDPISLVPYTLELYCIYSGTAVLPRTIQGTYLIHDPLYLNTDNGTFYVETYGLLL